MSESTGGAAPVLTVTLNPAIDRVVDAPGFSPGEHVRVHLRRITPAGKGINVARGVRLLGGRAEACALVGRAEETQYRDMLDGEDIPAHLVLVGGSTRVNTTILDTELVQTTHLREEGFHVSSRNIEALKARILDVIERMTAEWAAPYVAFCGSLPPGFPSDAFLSLLRAVMETDARVVLDTGGDLLREAIAAGVVDVVKPNLSELRQCLGRDVAATEAPEAARELLDSVQRVLLTLERDGAYHIGPEGIAAGRCPVPDSEVKNTVGAGDAFLSGWLVARGRGCGVEESLKRATAAGSAAVTCEGTVGHTAEKAEEMLARYARM